MKCTISRTNNITDSGYIYVRDRIKNGGLDFGDYFVGSLRGIFLKGNEMKKITFSI